MKPDKGEWGPAMKALNHKQRRFVLALVNNPATFGYQTRAARAAGYCKGNPNRHTVTAAAHQVAHNEKVLLALREMLSQQFRLDAALGHKVLTDIAANPKHPAQLKAGVELLNRGGFNVMHEKHVVVTHRMDDAEMVERITVLCAELGMDSTKLLGNAALPAPAANGVTIEGEVVAAPSIRVTRYVPRERVAEFLKVGWWAPHAPEKYGDDRPLIEVIWHGKGAPVEPDARAMSS
jgi:hypothetical protein